jgi:hypothetical protein
MPRSATDGSRPHESLLAQHAARVGACWPLVHVESVSVAPGPSGDRARALVQLGGLAPADVRVELISTSLADSAEQDERRMCSIQSYGNGSVVFEATLPPHDVARAHEWLVHVHPSEALEAPRVEYHFRTGAP